jgi:hypothetical protein
MTNHAYVVCHLEFLQYIFEDLNKTLQLQDLFVQTNSMVNEPPKSIVTDTKSDDSIDNRTNNSATSGDKVSHSQVSEVSKSDGPLAEEKLSKEEPNPSFKIQIKEDNKFSEAKADNHVVDSSSKKVKPNLTVVTDKLSLDNFSIAPPTNAKPLDAIDSKHTLTEPKLIPVEKKSTELDSKVHNKIMDATNSNIGYENGSYIDDILHHTSLIPPLPLRQILQPMVSEFDYYYFILLKCNVFIGSALAIWVD